MGKPKKSSGKKTPKDLKVKDANEVKGGATAPVKYLEVKMEQVVITGP